eukprot:gene3667-4221_t
MKLLFNITILLLCASLTLGDLWSHCPGDTASDTFEIETLTVNPNPPLIGKSVAIALKGNLKSKITDGNSVFTVEMFIGGGWHGLPNFKKDVCDVIKCPVAPGQFSYATSIDIPFITPRGQYRGQFQLTDQDGKNITCLTFATTLGTK